MITLDTGSPVPAYEQIRSQIAGQIHAGQIPAGQRLPSIRQLATDLRIAPGTVARAYSELESGGLIESGRGGTRVRADHVADVDVRTAAERFARQAHESGLDEANALGLVRTAWRRIITNEPGHG